jgi:hexosaminidase
MYDWDPTAAAPGVPESSLLGVESPLWSETLADIRDFELMAFPRLAALAEVAWTRQEDRDWDDFRERLGAQGPRWTALGLNFYRAPEIPWR